MTVTSTEIKRLKDSILSPMRVSTEQDELNILAEEQEIKAKKQSEKFQSFKKDLTRNNLSS
jgi:predicted transcriptional regulator